MTYFLINFLLSIDLLPTSNKTEKKKREKGKKNQGTEYLTYIWKVQSEKKRVQGKEWGGGKSNLSRDMTVLNIGVMQ